MRHQGADKPLKKDSNRRSSNEVLQSRIRAIHAEARGAYGYPKMWEELVTCGFRVGMGRVRRMMQEYGIKARGKQKAALLKNSQPEKLGV